MRMSRLHVENYKALRDVTIPLSHFGCMIGENNSGKSSFLQVMSLFFSGSRLLATHYFDETRPVRIEIVFDDIGDADLAQLAEEHRIRVSDIVKNGRLVLVRSYGTDGRNSLLYNTLVPTDTRFSADSINSLVRGQRPGRPFIDKVLETFPELSDVLETGMNQEAIRQKIQELANSLPDDQKTAADLPLPTGIDKSIIPMLPIPIYIPAVKDLADDVKTTESTPFGKILAILLRAVESKLPDAQRLFEELNSKLNRVQQPDGTVLDARLDEVKLIESMVEKYVRESFANVALRITIPPPELKTVFSSARIFANDGVEGLIDTKGDGLRRAIVFSVLRTYVELNTELLPPPAEAVPEETSPLISRASYLLLFEEPELFLHPKAQNVLFDVLRVFAKEHHVLVTTHSPLFFGPGATETFIKLRKVTDPDVANRPFTQAQPVDLSDMTAKDQFQIICFENNNAAFFAETVVLVEGDSDYLLFPHIARTINPSWNVVQIPVLFVRIMGKGNIRRYREFFTRFGVRVPIISDLDLILNGFRHVNAGNGLSDARDELLSKVDEIILREAGKGEESVKDAKDAHESGELRGLWQHFKQRQIEFQAGLCSQELLDEAAEEFFAWQRKSDRLRILRSSDNADLLQKKWKLLAMLRAVDVFVLERGSIEQYYPEEIIGPDKPSRAQDFCLKVNTREAVLDCCGEQDCLLNGAVVKEKEFNLIFGSIFDRNG